MHQDKPLIQEHSLQAALTICPADGAVLLYLASTHIHTHVQRVIVLRHKECQLRCFVSINSSYLTSSVSVCPWCVTNTFPLPAVHQREERLINAPTPLTLKPHLGRVCLFNRIIMKIPIIDFSVNQIIPESADPFIPI